MDHDLRRRDFLTLMGVGGVWASGLAGCGGATPSGSAAKTPTSGRPKALAEDFFFLQLSDTHWGFKGPPNPEADTCLRQTVAAINAIEVAFAEGAGRLPARTAR